MSIPRSLTLLACAAILFFLDPSAFPQTAQGTISGTVTDVTGAAIPGVAVRITNVETEVSSATSTNSEGIYRAPYLNPGMYRINFEGQGFKKLTRSNIQVRSSEIIRVDTVLEVGSLVESIEVSASASLLETETSSTGHLVTGSQLTKLPTPR